MFHLTEEGLLVPDELGDRHHVAPMAKVINPLLSVEARGRMAGLVYNTWHGISTVKAHSGPNQPNSAAQLAARSRLTTIGAEWRALTQANRDAWAVYADAHPLQDWTGNPKRLTGQNWYIRCSVQMARMGNASVATPPATAAPDPFTTCVLSKPAADLQLSWGAPVDGTDDIDIWLLGPLSTGVDPKIEHATFEATHATDVGQPLTILAAVPSGRWRCWIRVIKTADGLTSTWMSDILDVA